MARGTGAAHTGSRADRGCARLRRLSRRPRASRVPASASRDWRAPWDRIFRRGLQESASWQSASRPPTARRQGMGAEPGRGVRCLFTVLCSFSRGDWTKPTPPTVPRWPAPGVCMEQAFPRTRVHGRPVAARLGSAAAKEITRFVSYRPAPKCPCSKTGRGVTAVSLLSQERVRRIARFPPVVPRRQRKAPAFLQLGMPTAWDAHSLGCP